MRLFWTLINWVVGVNLGFALISISYLLMHGLSVAFSS